VFGQAGSGRVKGSSKMKNTSLLMWGVIFGAVGLGFFTYGRKQKAPMPLFSGVALFILPYLISNVYVLVIVGVVFVLLPYFVRI
jgi:RsiW-degrading membrane proteinase PrsW (M82 family)